MNASNAVDSVRANNRQVSHVDALSAILFNERHAAQALIVSGPVVSDFLEFKVHLECILIE